MLRWLRMTLAETLQGCKLPNELMKTAAFYRSEPLGKCNQNPRGAGSKVQLAGNKFHSLQSKLRIGEP